MFCPSEAAVKPLSLEKPGCTFCLMKYVFEHPKKWGCAKNLELFFMLYKNVRAVRMFHHPSAQQLHITQPQCKQHGTTFALLE